MQQKAMAKNKCFLYCNGLMDHICPYLNGNNSLSLGNKPWYSRPGHFNGTFDAFVKIIRYEGLASLWSGLPPTLVMAVPATVIYFTTYDRMKYALGYTELQNQTWIPVLSGALARVGAVTVISPMEMMRTKLQSERLSYQQLGSALRLTVRQEGLLSLWRGLGPTLLRDVPFSVVYWVAYERMKANALRLRGEPTPTVYETFVNGALAGTLAGVLTLPFDVVKTYRQIEMGDVAALSVEKRAGWKASSTWHIMLRIQRQQGFTALFAGLVPRVIKIAPACAIMISTYEFCKTFFRQQNEKRLLTIKSGASSA